MAELLIANSSRGAVEKGDIWEIRANDSPVGGAELTHYVILKIPDRLMSELDQYALSWNIELDYTIVNQNLGIDGHRIRVSNTKTNSTSGSITRAQVENFLTGWGAIVFSASQNEVIFDCSINGILESESFWEVDITGAVFTEVSYDQGTGIHRISLDYSALANNPSYAERYILRHASSIISHANKVIVFEVERDTILSVLKDGIKDKVERLVKRKQYKLKSAAVDYITGQGGVVTDTYANFLTNLTDKLTE
ncbi:MAG: hypothetical protein GY928_34505 [Colwellia sp.]|nr:hypothetical protein [Colwellia sp.]